MNNLKELTWEHHKDAERQVFVKELMGGISNERYADFLHALHPQYHLLETFQNYTIYLMLKYLQKYGKIFANLMRD